MLVSAQPGDGKTQKHTEQQRQPIGQEPLRRDIEINTETFAHTSENDPERTVSTVCDGADRADILRMRDPHLYRQDQKEKNRADRNFGDKLVGC